MYPSLTPKETLWFAAQLKLPMGEGKKKQKVASLIKEVNC